MKKVLLVTLTVCLALLGMSQERAKVSKQLKNLSIERELKLPVDSDVAVLANYEIPATNPQSVTLIGDETEIIESLYDLQSNANLSNRIWAWDDGTIAAVSTRGFEQPATTGGWPDRGTGYNYFDGTAWAAKPTTRIESARCGWPNISPWGGNGEIIISHTPTTLRINRRATKGIGAWEELPDYTGPGGTCDPSWPRVTTSGENNEYTHLFFNSFNAYEGQTQALLYSRSTDGGSTWDIQDVILEDLNSDHYLGISADDYVLASKGNTVILLCASAWFDLFMLRSDDNGETWQKTTIWEHPIPFYDIATQYIDTCYAPDNSAQVAIDPNGMAHVVFGINRVLRDQSNQPSYFSSFPYYDGIGYWNESMEAPIPEPPAGRYFTLDPDYLYSTGNLIGWTQDVNGDGEISFEGTGGPPSDFPFANYRQLGLSTMPTITIDENGVIAVAYSSVTETYVTSSGMYNYRHTWVRTSPDLGVTWGEFYDLQAGNIFHMYDECIYAQFTPKSTADKFLMMYQADELVGVYLEESEQLEPSLNRTIFNAVDKSLIVGINETAKQEHQGFYISQTYPNPASGITNITVDASVRMDVSVAVYSMTGQLALDLPETSIEKGQKNVALDVSSLSPGVYFCKVSSGYFFETRKLVIK
jgi:hypothetical protein